MRAINHEPAPEQDTKNVESEILPVTTTKDEPQQSTTIASAPSAPPTSVPTTKTAQEEESGSLPATTTLTNPVPPATSASTSVSAAPQTSTSAPAAPPLSVTLHTDTFTAASPSTTAVDMQDIDFDSMFEDLENADLAFGQTDANVDVADVSSLLPGIDTYINIQDADAAGGGTTGSDSQAQKVEGGEVGDLDFDMLGLPGGEEGQKQEGDLQFGDNNFDELDELFEFGEWAAGEGGGEGDGGLDENWLKNLE
jgi:hypothetical protein